MEDFITRRLRERADARIRKQNRTTPIPVSEDAVRSWRPEDVCPDYAANVVLETLLERRLVVQAELSEELAVRLELKLNTARAYVSGALLGFREAGWVRCVTVPGYRRPEWEVID